MVTNEEKAALIAEGRKLEADMAKSAADSEKSVESSMNNTWSKVEELWKGVTGIAANASKEFQNFKNDLMKDKDAIDAVTGAYIAFRTVTKTEDLFKDVAKSTGSFTTASKQMEVFGGDYKVLMAGLGKMDPTGVLAKGLEQVGVNVIENAGRFQKSEQAMISMLSTGGNLSKMFKEDGTSISDLKTQTLKYVDSLGDVAEANAMTLSTITPYAHALNSIPGFMDENIHKGSELTNNTSALNVAMKLMVGSGQDFSEVQEALTSGYENIGNASGAVNNKAEKGLALFALTSSLSKQLGITFQETSGYLGDMAKQFKFIGDNTEATANIMARFTDGLRNTGLTSSASIEIIKGMTESVAKLSIGTKAFISARSGGPGGIQGSLQIDEMRRAGKTDEVMTMMLSALKEQFGGRIVTRGEGAQSQEAAAMFMQQKMMLQSGAFGGMVGTGPEGDEKAARLLEALAAGDIGKAAKTADAAIGEVAKQGNDLQQKNNTVLNKVALFTERSAIATQALALRSLENFGVGNEKARESLKKDMEGAAIKTGERDARTGVLHRDIRGTGGDVGQGEGDPRKQYDGLMAKYRTMLISSASSAVEIAGSGSVMLAKQVADGGAELIDVANKSINAIMEKRKDNKTASGPRVSKPSATATTVIVKPAAPTTSGAKPAAVPKPGTPAIPAPKTPAPPSSPTANAATAARTAAKQVAASAQAKTAQASQTPIKFIVAIEASDELRNNLKFTVKESPNNAMANNLNANATNGQPT